MTDIKEETLEPARLIPVSGIGGQEEQERRASSALLAVIGAVTEFQRALLKPLGAPSGAVRTYTEVPLSLPDGRKLRIDGLIIVQRGSRVWRLAIEVKSGINEHTTQQVESYLDLVRAYHLDGLLTISNQISAASAQHPVKVDGKRYHHLSLFHLSWSRILAIALMVKDHAGVKDPDQAWILGELVRYLQYPGSGALAFEDMGPEWVGVREAIRHGTLTLKHEGAADIAERWDQLLQFACFRLGTRLGREVRMVVSRSESTSHGARQKNAVRMLVESHLLKGAISIPDALGPVAVEVDLRSMLGTASVKLDASDHKQPVARVNWLLRQLRDSPTTLRIDVNFPHIRSPNSALLAAALDNPRVLLDGVDKLPSSFRVAMSAKMGAKRRAGRGGFITDVLDLVESFYGDVVQGLRPFTPPAPRLPRKESARDTEQETPIEAPPPDSMSGPERSELEPSNAP